MDDPPLEVIHTPNPCDQHASDCFPKDPFPFMWYYRTEVRNNTDVPLRVVSFEAYLRIGGRWMPRNVKNCILDGDDFRQWYGGPDGEPASGPIPPRSSAVCQVNWHGTRAPWSPRCKWVYKAVDDQGNQLEAEAEVVAKMVRSAKALRWLALRVVIAIGVILLMLWRYT